VLVSELFDRVIITALYILGINIEPPPTLDPFFQRRWMTTFSPGCALIGGGEYCRRLATFLECRFLVISTSVDGYVWPLTSRHYISQLGGSQLIFISSSCFFQYVEAHLPCSRYLLGRAVPRSFPHSRGHDEGNPKTVHNKQHNTTSKVFQGQEFDIMSSVYCAATHTVTEV
jgi:hypothetical protein